MRELPLDPREHRVDSYGYTSYDLSLISKNMRRGFIHPYLTEIFHLELTKKGIFLFQPTRDKIPQALAKLNQMKRI